MGLVCLHISLAQTRLKNIYVYHQTVGSLAETMNTGNGAAHLDDAISAYEQALRANPNSIPAMNAISLILRTKEDFSKAAEYLQAIIKLDARNGEAWGSLGKWRRIITPPQKKRKKEGSQILFRTLFSYDG